MSLKALHIVFITASTLLTLGFGAWELRAFFNDEGLTIDLVMGSIALMAAAGLVVYGRYFLKKLKDVSYL
jgi:hypothetical protein